MADLAVIGLGSWGTTLAHHLASIGHKVLGWSVDPGVVAGINKEHHNPNYVSSVKLHPGVRATDNLKDVFALPHVVVALPSFALSDVLPKLKLDPQTLLISAVKGLEHNSLLTPLQYAEQYLPVKCELAVLSGPSFAKDVIAHRPCGVVAASTDETIARRVAELFTSDWMRIYLSTDPLGVELGGISKNVIAIAAGATAGLDLGDSARAGVITRGLAEMMRLADAMGAQRLTLSGLSGLGDLAMTASSNTSRNYAVGYRLGRGEALAQVLASLGEVAEGVKTAPLILQLAAKYRVEMPIASRVVDLLDGRVGASTMVRELITRPIKREFD